MNNKSNRFEKPKRNADRKRQFSEIKKSPVHHSESKKSSVHHSESKKYSAHQKIAKDKTVSKEKIENNEAEDKNLLLIGRNAVLEALNTDSNIDRILFKKGEIEGSLRVIAAKAKERRIVVQEVAKEKLDTLIEGETGNHQGVIALCPAFPYSELSDILQYAKDKGEEPFIVVLDEISDPHNLGAIIRTADAAGAHGVIIPKRRACGLTSTVVRASAGAAAHVHIARVTNISNTLAELKKKGLWIACADMEGENLYSAPLTGAMCIVIGGEGDGVGSLVRKNCDFAVQIPMKGKILSLNASVAAAVVMYEVVRRRVGQ